ncbi:MAG: hypothetical protein JNJ47_07005 [Alphaproteobacteria bacterium]|nr:hypothetical protein [Alphaproteobacteria bacterium]
MKIGCLLLPSSLFIFNICHASLNKVSEESQIIKSVLIESKKEKNQRDTRALTLIRDFSHQKLKSYAKKDEIFAKELMFGRDEDENIPEDAVDIIPLENGYLLLTVSTIDIGPKQNELYFFLIQNGRSDWVPLQFDLTKKEKGYKPWSLMCYKVKYEAPFLKINSRGTPESCAECGDTDIFLFKDDSFKLFRTLRTFIDLEKQFEDLNKGLDADSLDYIKEEIVVYQ